MSYQQYSYSFSQNGNYYVVPAGGQVYQTQSYDSYDPSSIYQNGGGGGYQGGGGGFSAGIGAGVGGLLSGIGSGVGNVLGSVGLSSPMLQQNPQTAGIIVLLVIAAVIIAASSHK